MEKTNYKKASLYYLIGTMFNKGISFLTVPIFTRLLSTADYGIINTYNSYVSIIYMIMGLAIYMGIRAAFIDYTDKIDSFMSSATSFTIVNGCLVSAFIIVGASL